MSRTASLRDLSAPSPAFTGHAITSESDDSLPRLPNLWIAKFVPGQSGLAIATLLVFASASKLTALPAPRWTACFRDFLCPALSACELLK